MRCKYTIALSGPDYNENYECPHEALGGGLCIFHDSLYLTEATKQEVHNAIIKEIKEARNHNQPIRLIGYFIPDIIFDFNFYERVFFDHAKFTGRTTFQHISFQEKVSFSNVVFHQLVTFEDCEFSKCITFDYSVFKMDVFFSSVRFFGDAFFRQMKFLGDVSFSTRTTFEKRAVFYDPIFAKRAVFSYCTFNELDFATAGATDFSSMPFQVAGEFTQVAFLKQEETRFNLPLHNVYFQDTDVTRVKFGDKVVWQIDTGRKFGFKIYSERLLESNLAQNIQQVAPSLESIISEYRNLRENCEYYLRYHEAGEFFIREMEMQRIYEQVPPAPIRQKGFLRRNFSFARIYELLSKYGESSLRPLIVLVATFIVASFYFHYACACKCNDAFFSIRQALSALLPFINLDSSPGIASIIFKAIMLPVVGVLFISLRRRFERRFRH